MSVYFAEAGGYMKIGHSRDPLGRSTSITRLGTRPDDLPRGADARLIGWIPGDVTLERALHAQHHETRVAGEWFRLDVEHVQALIWQDPRGVDIRRMSAFAVFAAIKHPELTRDQIEAAGIRVLAKPEHEAIAAVGAMFSAALNARAS